MALQTQQRETSSNSPRYTTIALEATSHRDILRELPKFVATIVSPEGKATRFRCPHVPQEEKSKAVLKLSLASWCLSGLGEHTEALVQQQRESLAFEALRFLKDKKIALIYPSDKGQLVLCLQNMIAAESDGFKLRRLSVRTSHIKDKAERQEIEKFSKELLTTLRKTPSDKRYALLQEVEEKLAKYSHCSKEFERLKIPERSLYTATRVKLNSSKDIKKLIRREEALAAVEDVPSRKPIHFKAKRPGLYPKLIGLLAVRPLPPNGRSQRVEVNLKISDILDKDNSPKPSKIFQEVLKALMLRKNHRETSPTPDDLRKFRIKLIDDSPKTLTSEERKVRVETAIKIYMNLRNEAIVIGSQNFWARAYRKIAEGFASSRPRLSKTPYLEEYLLKHLDSFGSWLKKGMVIPWLSKRS